MGKFTSLTYDFKPPTYLSGAGRHDDSTSYTVAEHSFDEGATVKNSASGGNLTLQPIERGELGLSLKTNVLDGTGTIIVTMELVHADETAEEIKVYAIKPLRPNQHPVETGLFLWASIKYDSKEKHMVVEMEEKNEYSLVGNGVGSGYVLLHEGDPEKPVVLIQSQTNHKTPYSIGPKADPMFMLCVVSGIERIKRSQIEARKMMCSCR